MSELRTLLRRVRDQVESTARPGSIDELMSYRARKARRDRIAAGSLALVVALGALVLVVATFQPSGRRSTGSSVGGLEADPRVAATIRIGSKDQMRSILAADNRVWVVHGTYGDGDIDSSLYRLDPGTNRIEASTSIDTVPTSGYDSVHRGLAYGFGSVWIVGIAATSDSPSEVLLQRLDPETLRVTATVPLGDGAGTDVSVNGSGVWVSMTDGHEGQVVKIDPATNDAIATTRLEVASTIRIAAVSRAIIVQQQENTSGNASSPCHVLTSIDPTTSRVIARAPVGAECTTGTLLAWRDEVWISTESGLLRVDPRTAETHDSGVDFEKGHSPRSFIAADETGIWYGAYSGADGSSSDVLTWLSPSGNQRRSFLQLTNGPFAAVLLQDALWTANSDGTVSRIDLRIP